MLEVTKTLLLNDPTIEQGVAKGLYEIVGGVVRDLRTKKVAKWLVDASPGNAASALGQVGHAASALNQVASIASVLNVGVSVAGFAYMGYKLHQLQRGMQALQGSLDRVGKDLGELQGNVDRIEEKLDALGGELRCVLLLTQANALAIDDLKSAIDELHRFVLMRDFIDLTTDLEHRGRFPDEPVRDSLRIASRSRDVFRDQALRLNPGLHARTLLLWEVAVRGWVVATATEAQLLAEAGRSADAIALLAREAKDFRAYGERWAEALLAHERPQLATAHRFSVPRLRGLISDMSVTRIARLSPRDKDLDPHGVRMARDDAEIEMKLEWVSRLPDSWDREQVLRAEILDGMSELAARLDAKQYYLELCGETGVKPSDIVAGDTAPGVYAVTFSEAGVTAG